jgi:hypothetical protein
MSNTPSNTFVAPEPVNPGQGFKDAFEEYLASSAWDKGQHGYHKVKVLQVYWNAPNDLTAWNKKNNAGLRAVFVSVFRFTVSCWPIPDNDSHAQ